jgi:glucose/mannose-6-phosphate isomerase
VVGMGGSALGAHVIKSLYFSTLKIPLEIVNGYSVPEYTDKNSLVIFSSYSGTTEEVLYAMKTARIKKAKTVIITSGGELSEIARTAKIPALIFTTKNNPCGSPRMGLGYLIIGQIILLSKIGFLKIGEKDIKQVIGDFEKYNLEFGVGNSGENAAKKIAQALQNKSVWYAGAQHLNGNTHIAANQMNENAKRFAGYFIIPELNHHLMEGMMYPKSNQKDLTFVLLESKLYSEKIQKRFTVTKNILDKNKIEYLSYTATAQNPLAQTCEILVLSSYISYYSALLQGLDPTAIPFVDYFKQQLKK